MPTRVRVQREQVIKAFDNLREPKFQNATMQVGVVDDTIKYPDGTRLIDVALYNEFGTDRIPARPALRRAISRTTPKLIKLGEMQAKEMLFGRLRFDVAARRMAKIMVADMQKAIESFRTPPNAPRTIQKKGFNNPLIDTRLYKKSISFKLLRTRKDQR